MGDFPLKLVEQLPSTAAVIIVVVIFVKYITKRDDIWTELHAEHLEARKVALVALQQNTEALAKNTLAFQQVASRLEGIEYFCPVALEHSQIKVVKHQSRQRHGAHHD